MWLYLCVNFSWLTTKNQNVQQNKFQLTVEITIYFYCFRNLSYLFTFLFLQYSYKILFVFFFTIIAFIESSESDGKKRRKGKGQEILEETKITSSFAKQLDLSCMKSSIRAPNINNGHIVKYNRWENLQHIKNICLSPHTLGSSKKLIRIIWFHFGCTIEQKNKKKSKKNTQE